MGDHYGRHEIEAERRLEQNLGRGHRQGYASSSGVSRRRLRRV